MKLVLGKTGKGTIGKVGKIGKTVVRALPALVLAAACAACADAGSAGPGAAAVNPTFPPKAGTTVSTDAAASAGTSRAVGGTGDGTGRDTVPVRCATPDLELSTAPPAGGSGMGHQGLVLVFTNRTRNACVLTGYPGVAARDGRGQDAGNAARTTIGSIFPVTSQGRVVLEPNGSASAGVEWTVVPSGDQTRCPSYAGLRVTPPGDTRSLELAQEVDFCGSFQVHPVVPGAAAGA
ncbi:DUF4232 domain-containing protein [Candidatus Protofrankia californiensis]|uniref:DUF4232 domain-containing protein n=1 Tax=Candidatus Protofrankia californiensis TaxID=1839754 RepID=UPI001040E116|nr:DUF4232 domain-containing protein [Candidatus Protofrankia californiensis]